MTEETKISEESALKQIEDLLEYYGLSKEDIVVENGREAVETMTNGLVRMIQQGRLSVDQGEAGIVVSQTLKYPVGERTSIQYTDKISRARIAMDSVASKKDQARAYAFMAVLANVTVSELMNLRGADTATFSRLMMIFSMV